MTTDDERRRAAAALRKASVYTLQGRGDDGSVTEWSVALMSELAEAVGLEKFRGIDVYERLADLIDPDTTSDTTTDTTKTAEDTTRTPTSSDTTATCDMSQDCRDVVACDPTERGIDSIYDWCREHLEGADGAEDYMLCSIMSAIEEYRHPELAAAHTVRPVDREALLALADALEDGFGMTGSPSATQLKVLADINVELREYARIIREACGVVA